MDANNLKFPVICFERDFYPRIRQNLSSLTTTTKVGLNNGLFENVLLVDSAGYALKIKNAHKLHGVGPFWGYDIFLDRHIKVELVFEGTPFPISVDEVKKYIFKSFHNWHGWASRGDFDELKESVAKAQTIAEIIQIIAS